LDAVTKKKRVGYKVMYPRGENHVQGLYYGTPIQIGKWVKDRKHRAITVFSYGFHYPTGFHVYNNMEDPKETDIYIGSALYRVQMRKVVASGHQFGRPVTVCREIFIEKEVI